MISWRAFICAGGLLCAGHSMARGGQSAFRVTSSSSIRSMLESPVLADLERARSGLRLVWREAGPRGAMRDLLEGEADVAMMLERVSHSDIELAARLGLELHEHAVARDRREGESAVVSRSPSPSPSRTLWMYSLNASRDLRALLDFLRLQGGRHALEEAGLQPLLAATPRSLVRETDASASLIRVSFGYRGFRLGATARQLLDGLAKSLTGARQSLWIVGHVEPTESSRERDLSFLRAREVADYLERQGITPSRMRVEGVGAREPLTTHRTLEGRRQSRRAEIWVLPQP